MNTYDLTGMSSSPDFDTSLTWTCPLPLSPDAASLLYREVNNASYEYTDVRELTSYFSQNAALFSFPTYNSTSATNPSSHGVSAGLVPTLSRSDSSDGDERSQLAKSKSFEVRLRNLFYPTISDKIPDDRKDEPKTAKPNVHSENATNNN